MAVTDADGTAGFLKELHRPKDLRARGRFRREVASYETLPEHPSLPRLIDHNASAWQNRDIPLYMVLELVEGETLQEYVERNGPLALETAVDLVSRLAEAVQHCHENDVVHRDLKPANIVLRDGEPSSPVIVDFGLAFNRVDPDEPDLTRVGEEVGNRFLRLPEHAEAGRSPVSDVTQLVGLLSYCVSGVTPRNLGDHEGLAPHERHEARQAMNVTCGRGTHQLRFLQVLDRGFMTRQDQRFQSAEQLRLALEKVMDAEQASEGIDAVLDDIEALVGSRRQRQGIAAARSRLDAFRNDFIEALQVMARSRDLDVRGTIGIDKPEAYFPSCELQVALVIPWAGPTDVYLKVEMRGEEMAVMHDLADLWRGTDPSDEVLVARVARLMADVVPDRRMLD